MALATVPRGDGLALVHIGAPSKKDPVVSDGYGLKMGLTLALTLTLTLALTKTRGQQASS